MSQLDGFVDRYGRSIGVILVALFITQIPIINFVRFVPLLKEIVLGALVVVGLTSIDDWGQGAKYAVVSGMVAAIMFNVIMIPTSFVVGGLLGATNGTAESAAAAGALSGLGAFANLVGLVLFSPIGYLAGGAVGGLVN